MRVLLTGASGFIGRNILLAFPHWKIDAVYWSSLDFPEWITRNSLSHVTPKRVDLTDENSCETLKRNSYDAVLHLAANGDPAWSVQHPAKDLALNTISTIHLLKTVRSDRFVYFSSGAVYDGLQGVVHPETAVVRPNLPYAISNLASESYIAALWPAGQFVIIRFFGAYGPHEPARKIYTNLVKTFAFAKKPEFTLRGHGSNLIDAMFVSDAAEITRRIVEQPIAAPVLDVGCGQPLTLRDLVTQAAQAFGISNPTIHCKGEVPESIQFQMDPARLASAYQFRPRVSLRDGLKRLADHLIAEGQRPVSAS